MARSHRALPRRHSGADVSFGACVLPALALVSVLVAALIVFDAVEGSNGLDVRGKTFGVTTPIRRSAPHVKALTGGAPSSRHHQVPRLPERPRRRRTLGRARGRSPARSARAGLTLDAVDDGERSPSSRIKVARSSIGCARRSTSRSPNRAQLKVTFVPRIRAPRPPSATFALDLRSVAGQLARQRLAVPRFDRGDSSEHSTRLRALFLYMRQAAAKIRVVVAKPGLERQARAASAKIIARALRDAGMEVIYTGLHQTPEQIVQTAIQGRRRCRSGISILSGAHMTRSCRASSALLRKDGAEDVLVVVGGTIPNDDIAELEAAKASPRSFDAGRRDRRRSSTSSRLGRPRLDDVARGRPGRRRDRRRHRSIVPTRSTRSTCETLTEELRATVCDEARWTTATTRAWSCSPARARRRLRCRRRHQVHVGARGRRGAKGRARLATRSDGCSRRCRSRRSPRSTASRSVAAASSRSPVTSATARHARSLVSPRSTWASSRVGGGTQRLARGGRGRLREGVDLHRAADQCRRGAAHRAGAGGARSGARADARRAYRA